MLIYIQCVEDWPARYIRRHLARSFLSCAGPTPVLLFQFGRHEPSRSLHWHRETQLAAVTAGMLRMPQNNRDCYVFTVHDVVKWSLVEV